MTTILAKKIKEPYPAIILATDLQASSTKPVQGDQIIYLQQEKYFFRKINNNKDKSILIAMTGCYSRQYEDFINIVTGEKAPPDKYKDFSFINDLKSGQSSLVNDLNFYAMTSDSNGHLDTSKRFELAVVTRQDGELDLWYVTEVGAVSNQTEISLGSGSQYANQAINVIGSLGLIPAKYDTELHKGVYLLSRGLEYAMKDAHSTGLDVVVVSAKGVDFISEQILKKQHTVGERKELEILNALAGK